MAGSGASAVKYLNVAQRYYKSVIYRHSFAELWRITDGNPIAFLFACVIKIFRINLDTKQAIAEFRTLPRVDLGALPSVAVDDMSSILAQCQRAGLRVEFMYESNALSKALGYGVVLTSSDVRVLHQVLYGRTEVNGSVTKSCHFSSLTFLQDGRYMATTSGPKQANQPPSALVEHLRDKPVETILRRHAKRLTGVRSSIARLAPGDLEARVIELNNDFLNFSLGRGTLVPMGDEEVSLLRQELGMENPGPGVPSRG